MPRGNLESGSTTEESEVYDEGVCFLCKKALEDAPENVMCVMCHRYCHLGCTDLKGHPRLASLASTRALEFRISKDPETRRSMENVTVSHVGKLALFKYHCPACRRKLSRARQYDESQCRTLFNTLIELINSSETLHPPAPVRKKPEGARRRVKLEPGDASLQERPPFTKKDQLESVLKSDKGKEQKIRPAMAPSRESLNEKHAPSRNLNHAITSDTSSAISEPSVSSSDEFRPSQISSDTETGRSSLPSLDTDQSQQKSSQKSQLTDVQTPPPQRKPRKVTQRLTKKSNTSGVGVRRSAIKRLVNTENKKYEFVDEATQKLIDFRKSQLNDVEYLAKHYFKQDFRGFKMSRIYKVAGNLYKKIYFKTLRDNYHLQIATLTTKIKALESEFADLFSKTPTYVRCDFENLYTRIVKNRCHSTKYSFDTDTFPQVLEDSEEAHDNNAFISLHINYANLLGKYLLLKRFFITNNTHDTAHLQTIDFTRLLYPKNHAYTMLLARYASIQFIPIEAQLLNNFHDYFNDTTTEDILLSIETKNRAARLPVDFDNCSDMSRFIRADFLCDNIVTPKQIADDQFFIFALRSVSLFDVSLFLRHPSTFLDNRPKYDYLTTSLTQLIAYRSSEFSDMLTVSITSPITLSPYDFPEASQQVSHVLSKLELVPVPTNTISATNNPLRMMTHPIFDSVFKACLSKEFIQQMVKHDGHYYRVKNWTSDFVQLDVSLASINPLESAHLTSVCSAAPPSLDAISEQLTIYSRAGGFLFGRFYEYIEELCYMMSCNFKEELLPDLPEDYDDPRLVFDPAFYRYERLIMLHILSIIQPVDLFEIICEKDPPTYLERNKILTNFIAHAELFKSCYQVPSYSTRGNLTLESSENSCVTSSNEVLTEDDCPVAISKPKRAPAQLKRRVRP